MKNIQYLLPAVLLMLTGLVATIDAQPVGTWKSYTSQSTVFDIYQQEDGLIWVATDGGIFIVEEGEIIQSLTPTEGMYRINPGSVAYNPENDLFWLGYSDGTFEFFDRHSDTFRRFSDISRATRFSPRGINGFTMVGDNVLVITDFGLVLFEPEREITIDTYSNLGEFPSGSRVNDVVVDGDRIFAATSLGVAVSNIGADDLVVPDNWTSYGSDDGFDGTVSTLILFDGAIHALTNDKMLRFEGNEWSEIDYFQGADFKNVRVSRNGTYLAAWDDDMVMLWNADTGLQTFPVTEGHPVNTIWLNVDDADNNQIYLGTTNFGVTIKNLPGGEVVDRYLPSGPYMNSFSQVNVRDGIMASGSNDAWGRRGIGTSQTGYYLFRDGEWYNFNNFTHPLLQQYNFNSVFTSTNTSEYFYFGSWGRGLAQHHRETDEITIWDTTNSLIEGIQDASRFIVVSGLAADRHENLWVVSRGNLRNPLYRFEPDSENWTAFPRLQGLFGSTSYEHVMVDSHDQIWVTLRDDRDIGHGLAVKRMNGDDIDVGVILQEGTGSGNLPNNKVNTVVQDRRGEIWIGTERGVARFPFPQRVIDGASSDRQASLIINADETADSPYLLRTANITSIVVNSANQKWIGTDGEGVWLVEDEGGRHRALNNFTTENSPLISNSINSIAYDDVTGEVFIATDLGLVSYIDVVRGSVAEMDDLFIYPNPFSYNRENNERVVIDRLSSQTTIRILTVDGRLVRRLETRGGRVEWDVRDFKGDRVATGVYIVVSVDDQNDQRGVGKLVVIR